MSRPLPTLVLMVLLTAPVALLGAADESPTRVLWRGGDIKLDDAVALLGRDGNTTRLSPGTEGGRVALLPPLHGAYWEAVLAVCRTFDLTILPPRQWRTFPGYQAGGRNLELRVDAGPVVLAERVVDAGPIDLEQPTARDLAAWLRRKSRERAADEHREPAQITAQGHYLVSVMDAAIATTYTRTGQHSRVGLAIRARIEPRWRLDQLGPSRIAWLRARGADGMPLPIQSPVWRGEWELGSWHSQDNAQPQTIDSEPRPTITIFPDVAWDLKGFHLTGQALSEILKQSSAEIVLVKGQRRSIDLDGIPVEIWLHDAAMARKEGNHMGGVGLSFPANNRLGKNLQVTLKTTEGEHVHTAGDHNDPGGTEFKHLTFVHDVGDQPYVITLRAALVDAALEQTVDITVELP